jgi:hypothetical protein
MNRIVPSLAAFLCAGVASSAALAQTTQVIRGDVAAVEPSAVSYTQNRAHETDQYLVFRLQH